ncbi:MAG TPA: glycosyltransferase family 2 protein [Actinomycetota bacterium]|nr:glycosyltransferase family 2 protein [Actinomycetota bacterium]
MTVVAAIVPARNESARIADTVRALLTVDAIDEIIVVDDGSDDSTADLARGAGASVVRLPGRQGKGGALRAGLGETAADVVVFIDGDLGDTASIARELLEPVLGGTLDMSIASPRPTGPSGFGLVEGFSRLGIRALTGRRMDRPLSGQRALRRTVLSNAPIASRFGVETALTIDAVRGGFRVAELPLEFEHTGTGRTARGFAHRARQGADVVAVLVSRLRPRAARP